MSQIHSRTSDGLQNAHTCRLTYDTGVVLATQREAGGKGRGGTRGRTDHTTERMQVHRKILRIFFWSTTDPSCVGPPLWPWLLSLSRADFSVPSHTRYVRSALAPTPIPVDPLQLELNRLCGRLRTTGAPVPKYPALLVHRRTRHRLFCGPKRHQSGTSTCGMRHSWQLTLAVSGGSLFGKRQTATRLSWRMVMYRLDPSHIVVCFVMGGAGCFFFFLVRSGGLWFKALWLACVLWSTPSYPMIW